jgi:hypothetical protein
MSDYDRIAGLRQDWTPPRELAGSIREVRLSGSGTALLALAAVLALGGIAAGFLLSPGWRRRRTAAG